MPKRTIFSRTERRPPSATLLHEFWLLRAEDVDPLDYRAVVARRDAPLRLSDDVISHLNYSLRWVPTFNPGTHVEGNGLNLYSATVIRGGGAAKLASICAGWLQIFGHGPEVLGLSGCISTVVGLDLEPTEYVVEVLELSRDDLLRDLGQLASFAEQAAHGDHYILHAGL